MKNNFNLKSIISKFGNKAFFVSTFVFLFYSLSNCNTKNQSNDDLYSVKYWNEIPYTKELSGHKLDLKGIVFPRIVKSIGNYIIISEKVTDTLFHLIDKESFEIVKRFGISGVGPGEIEPPWNLYSGKETNSFWAHQLSSKTLDKFSINQSSNYSEKSIKPRNELVFGVNLIPINDSIIMGIHLNNQNKFIEFNNNGKILKEYGNWRDNIKQDLPINVISSLFQGQTSYNPIRDVYGLVCLNVDVIELLNRETGKILSIVGPLNHMPDFKVDYSPGYPMLAIDLSTDKYCFGTLSFGEDLFYVSYSGVSGDEVNNGIRYINSIFAFNYNGEIQFEFKLDKTISAFDIDEERKQIYGVSFDENPNLVVFDYQN